MKSLQRYLSIPREHTEGAVDLYIKVIITAGIRTWKYEAAEDALCSVVLQSIMIHEFLF